MFPFHLLLLLTLLFLLLLLVVTSPILTLVADEGTKESTSDSRSLASSYLVATEGTSGTSGQGAGQTSLAVTSFTRDLAIKLATGLVLRRKGIWLALTLVLRI